MELDEKLVGDIAAALESQNPKIILSLSDESFEIDSAKISKETVPVTRRTQRGGAYFADTEIFKVRAQTQNRNIIPLISKAMLGPNKEFGDVQLHVTMELSGKDTTARIHTNLTDSRETSTYVELGLSIVSVKINS